jgi:hypothetical protein
MSSSDLSAVPVPSRGAVSGANGRLLLQASNPNSYPRDLVDGSRRWLLWEPYDGRKIPRNPEWGFTTNDAVEGYALASPKDPRAWWSFDVAKAKAESFDALHLGYYLPRADWSDWDDDDLEVDVDALQDGEPHVALVDFDDVRDPETGAVAPAARRVLGQLAATYVEWSPSGAGIHALGRFSLPGDLTSLAIDLSSPRYPDASIELYTGSRYTTVTGDHIPGAGRVIRDISGPVDSLLADHQEAVDAALDRAGASEPSPTDSAESGIPGSLTSLKETTDIETLYQVIERTTPSDLYLKSPVTEVRNDGTRSRDPCWADSDSGTRLAEFNDGWMWRDGELALDALQVVALEEGIVHDPAEYPSGSDWWKALDALRARGVPVPKLVSD